MDKIIVSSKSKKQKNTCIDCGVQISATAIRCFKCFNLQPKSKRPRRTCIDCGVEVYRYSIRCKPCKGRAMCKPESERNTCLDCGTPVNRKNSRCRSCWLKFKETKKFCIDCGAEIIKTSTRCIPCREKARRKQPSAYHMAAENKGFLWIGNLPPSTHSKTLWRCKNGHEWETTYDCIQGGKGCPLCIDYENGVVSSKPQRAVYEMVGGIQNYRIGRYSIDVALQLPIANVAIEYDSWYYHANQAEPDARKTTHLLGKGWKVLRIKSSKMIPTFDQIQGCIFDLLAGADYAEIVLPDWGKGKAR